MITAQIQHAENCREATVRIQFRYIGEDKSRKDWQLKCDGCDATSPVSEQEAAEWYRWFQSHTPSLTFAICSH
jgi:hypothetical protein